MVAGSCGSANRDVSVGMKGAVAGGWRDHYRAIVFRPENLGGHVDGTDINQPARPQLGFQEALAIGAKGHLIVDAGDHVTEVRRRHILLRDRLESNTSRASL